MELRQLRYFVTVAEERHFGRAAEYLHIVQPAVSQQIARLERELGVVLFDRSHRRVALTADGEAFLPHALRVLRAADHAARVGAELAAGGSGLLRVGSSEVLGPRLADILTALRASHPGITVDLVPGPTPTKLAAVAAGDLDAAFVRAAQPPPGVVVHPLWDEPLVVALPTERAGPGYTIDLASLGDLPLARTARADNPGVHDLITAACLVAGFTPTPGPSFGNVQDLLAGTVAAGRCWTVLFTATPLAGPPTHVVLREPVPSITVPTGLAMRHPPRRPIAEHLLAAARSVTGLPTA